MSGGMPEIGSKISLISRADIRYEGRLFTVDPQECTIALSNVRSFGTEDRETQYPIAPQNQVYDYILFRGSDIKDIRVVPPNVPPMPNDPAIMQMQPQNQMGHQGFQPQFPVPVMGPQMGQFGAPYGPMGGYMGGLAAAGLAPGSSGLSAAIAKQKQTSVLDLIGGGSRSTTPISLISRKSPTADMGVQVNQPRSSSRDGNKKNSQMRGRERHDSGRNNNEKQDNRDGGRNDYRMSDRPQYNQNQRPNQQMNHQQQNNQSNRGWNRGNNNMRGRPRGRGGPHQYDNQQAFRQQQGGQGGGPGAGGAPAGGLNNPNNKRGQSKTIKFDSDYDFEQANNKFEELRSQLSKLKVGEEAKPEQVNGEVDKKDDSGNETGAGDNEHEEDGEVNVNVGYDKTKSFFDNISCEASIERNKGKNRTDWRQERKLNSETFGISSTRRGGYRGGRGGYFSRNPGSGYRGGGGYRGGYNNRGRNMRPGQYNNGPPGQPTPKLQQQPQPALPPITDSPSAGAAQ